MATSKSTILWILLLTSAHEVYAQNPNVCATPQCKATAEWFSKNMLPHVPPCYDFYQFACGNFPNVYAIPAYSSYKSAFSVRHEKLMSETKALLTQEQGDIAEAVRVARHFYEICMDEETIERNGDVALATEFTKVGLPLKPPYNTPPSKDTNFSQLLARFHRYSLSASFLFSIGVEPDMKNTSKNYLTIGYTPAVRNFSKSEAGETEMTLEMLVYGIHKNEESDAETKEFRNHLTEYMLKVVHYMYEQVHFQYTKITRELVEKRANDVIDFLLKLEETKKLEKPRDDMANPTYVTMDELQKITDEILENAEIKIDWYDYIETLYEDIRVDVRDIFKNGEKIMIMNVEQLKAVLRIVSEVNAKVFYSALWWSNMNGSIALFTKPLKQFWQEFEKKTTNQDTEPREKTCISKVANAFGFLVGYRMLFAENHIQKRDKILEMLGNIRASFGEMIENTHWLDDSTKMAALNKLNFVTNIVSFVQWMANPNELNNSYIRQIYLRDFYYTNLSGATLAGRKGNLNWLARENNYQPGAMSPLNPAQVNACYSPLFNTINIPIGIMGFPFYDLGLECLNYGALGVVLGHELGHGFDDMGKKFSHKGEYSDWWKKKASKEYERRSKCYVKSYNRFYFRDAGKYVDGKHTLGENIADNTGMKVAIMAYHKFVAAHGTEPKLINFEFLTHEKLLTLAFANIWCVNAKPSLYKFLIGGDEHAPPEARVRGVAKNSKDFAEIWSCRPKQPMNPQRKCQIWD